MELKKADEMEDVWVVMVTVIGSVAMAVCKLEASGIVCAENGMNILP